MKELPGRLWAGLKRFALIWGRTVNTILLSIVYFTVFGLTGLIARLFGQDLLGIRSRPKAESLWRDREDNEVDFEASLHQF